MAIAFVQTGLAYSSTTTLTRTLTTTAGNFLFVSIAYSNTLTSISDNRGNTYTYISNVGTGVRVYYAKNVPAGSTTITVTFSSAPSFRNGINVGEYSGVDSLDVYKVISGTADAASVTTDTPTTNAESLVLGVLSGTVNIFATVGAGFTFAGLRQASNNSAYTEYKTVSSTGIQTATYSTSVIFGTNTWDFGVFTFNQYVPKGVQLRGKVKLRGKIQIR